MSTNKLILLRLEERTSLSTSLTIINMSFSYIISISILEITEAFYFRGKNIT